MGHAPEIKIRALPRKNEPSVRREPARDQRPDSPFVRPVTLGALAVSAALGVGLALGRGPAAPRVTDHASSPPTRVAAAVADPILAKLNRYEQDARVKEEILRQSRQLENLRTKDPSLDVDPSATASDLASESYRSYGVQMDSENTAERLFAELNDRPSLNVDQLPEARINARLANRKWMNELERQERVQFVRNFIRTAYDRGYEVDLDQNLVVIGVRPIRNRRVDINQALERVSKQGL